MLCARRYFDLYPFSVKGRNLNVRSQRRLRKTDGNGTVDVVTLSLEVLVREYMDNDVQIPGLTTTPSCVALPGNGDPLPRGYTGWNSDLYPLPFLDDSAAATAGARLFHDGSVAAAGGTN
jgi:hypothetical protein